MKKIMRFLSFVVRAPLMLLLSASSLGNSFRDGAMAKVASASATRYKAAFYGAGASVSAATAAYTATGEIAASTNYPTGGVALTSTLPTSTTMTCTDKVINTAAGETIGPVSYILVYDTTDTNKVVAFLDYSATPKTASEAGGSFTIDFPAAMITLTVS